MLAAGRSTRFRSARSKLVHPLGGRPIIAVAAECAAAAPVRRRSWSVVVRPTPTSVRATCGPGVRFAVQDEPRGTGHAVLAARSALHGFDGSLLLLYGDLPLLRAETLRAPDRSPPRGRRTLSLLTATVADPRGWGRIVRRAGAVAAHRRGARRASQAQRAHPRGQRRRLLRARAAAVRAARSGDDRDNAQGEIYLTDIVGLRGRPTASQVADVDVDPAEVGQINSRGELAAMESSAARADQRRSGWQAGVTLEDPATAYIGARREHRRATRRSAPTSICAARTAIGEALPHRRLGVHHRLDDRRPQSICASASCITEAELGARCQIGPFAHLRPRTRLGRGGAHRRLRRDQERRLGRGTKANHLAYLGDAEIGRDANIGAGTITCNYDGFAKHRTVIGDRVQVGSDTHPGRAGADRRRCLRRHRHHRAPRRAGRRPGLQPARARGTPRLGGGISRPPDRLPAKRAPAKKPAKKTRASSPAGQTRPKPKKGPGADRLRGASASSAIWHNGRRESPTPLAPLGSAGPLCAALPDPTRPRYSWRAMFTTFRAPPKRPRQISPIEDAIADIKAGKMVILMDDEKRENEGDLCMAAEQGHARPRSTSWPSTAAA